MPELPSGAVTFLFSDIEGSTRLVKQLRDRWGDVLAEHQRLLREAFRNHRGYEIDTQGDSFFVAFASARDAVLAAVEAQLALLRHQWPEGADVKVRIGIHTGQAVASDGRYTGLAVHRAARIAAAAHGGQVLVSQSTQTLLDDEEEDVGIGLRDLGEHRLKDLDRPVRLYQVATDGLATEFPPVREQAEVAPAAQSALAGPLWRRPVVLVAALAVAAVTAVALFFVTRSGNAVTVRPNSVAVIDPVSAKVVGQVPVGARPDAVAAGDGTVWVANGTDKTVSRVDAGTATVRRAISVGSTPTGLAVGEGAVWVAQGTRGDVSRIDPSFDTVDTFHVTQPFPGGGLSGAVAVSPDSIWAAWGSSSVTRIDPATGRVLGTLIAGRSPAAIAYGDGAFWVANGGDNTVSKFSAETNRRVGLPIHVGLGPSAVVVGAGDVWVCAAVGGSVTRFDPRTGAATAIRVGARPTGIAFGEGRIWVADAGDGTVARIDPATNDVRLIKVGGSPAGIAVGAHRVWATVQAP